MIYAVGDRVWYVLGRGPGRPRALFVAARVVAVGDRRIGIITIDNARPRYVAPWSLTPDLPTFAVVDVIDTPQWGSP